MKTIQESKQEISTIAKDAKGHKLKPKEKARIKDLRQMIAYLETKPSEELVSKELQREERKKERASN